MDLCQNSDKAKFGLKEISEQESESDSGGSESDSDTSDPGSVISKDHKAAVEDIDIREAFKNVLADLSVKGGWVPPNSVKEKNLLFFTLIFR